MRVESVIWVSERKDVLYNFFFLAACINYLKYLDFEKERKYLIYSTKLSKKILPPLRPTYMNLGNVYLNAQMPEKALPDLEKAMSTPKLKDKKLTRGELATAKLNVGKYQEALNNYNIVID